MATKLFDSSIVKKQRDGDVVLSNFLEDGETLLPPHANAADWDGDEDEDPSHPGVGLRVHASKLYVPLTGGDSKYELNLTLDFTAENQSVKTAIGDFSQPTTRSFKIDGEPVAVSTAVALGSNGAVSARPTLRDYSQKQRTPLPDLNKVEWEATVNGVDFTIYTDATTVIDPSDYPKYTFIVADAIEYQGDDEGGYGIDFDVLATFPFASGSQVVVDDSYVGYPNSTYAQTTTTLFQSAGSQYVFPVSLGATYPSSATIREAFFEKFFWVGTVGSTSVALLVDDSTAITKSTATAQ